MVKKPLSPLVVIPKTDNRTPFDRFDRGYQYPSFIPSGVPSQSYDDDNSSTSSMMEIDYMPDGTYNVWNPKDANRPLDVPPTGLQIGSDEEIGKLMTGTAGLKALGLQGPTQQKASSLSGLAINSVLQKGPKGQPPGYLPYPRMTSEPRFQKARIAAQTKEMIKGTPAGGYLGLGGSGSGRGVGGSMGSASGGQPSTFQRGALQTLMHQRNNKAYTVRPTDDSDDLSMSSNGDAIISNTRNSFEFPDVSNEVL